MKAMKFSLIALLLVVVSLSCGDDPKPPEPIKVESIRPANGEVYRYDMGSSVPDSPMEFIVRDNRGNAMDSIEVRFALVAGDGSLMIDSAMSANGGMVTTGYSFEGVLGHAEIMALIPGVDTTYITLRANTLIYGLSGQGQYVHFDDMYANVVAINGTTTVDMTDSALSHPVMYVNYESALGVVVMLWDLNLDYTAYDTSSVLGVIVNGQYSGRIDDTIGIGSTIGEFTDVYNNYAGWTNLELIPGDLTEPDTYLFEFKDMGISLYTTTTLNIRLREIVEIHLSEFIGSGMAMPKLKVGETVPTNGNYHSFRF